MHMICSFTANGFSKGIVNLVRIFCTDLHYHAEFLFKNLFFFDTANYSDYHEDYSEIRERHFFCVHLGYHQNNVHQVHYDYLLFSTSKKSPYSHAVFVYWTFQHLSTNEYIINNNNNQKTLYSSYCLFSIFFFIFVAFGFSILCL